MTVFDFFMHFCLVLSSPIFVYRPNIFNFKKKTDFFSPVCKLETFRLNTFIQFSFSLLAFADFGACVGCVACVALNFTQAS